MAAGVGVGRSPTTHASAYATAVAPALAPPSRGFKFLIACLERPSVCDFKLYMLSARDPHTTAATRRTASMVVRLLDCKMVRLESLTYFDRFPSS